jgi:hypothetical protein
VSGLIGLWAILVTSVEFFKVPSRSAADCFRLIALHIRLEILRSVADRGS